MEKHKNIIMRILWYGCVKFRHVGKLIPISVGYLNIPRKENVDICDSFGLGRLIPRSQHFITEQKEISGRNSDMLRR